MVQNNIQVAKKNKSRAWYIEWT